MHTPGRGDGALRRYRVSLPETSYFLTLCSENRCTANLVREHIASTIRTEIAAIEFDGYWLQHAGVIMPDHLHLLVRLTGELAIARCVARLKSKTRSLLLAHNLGWQPNFCEHRLRPDEAVEQVIRYIFLNPYREGLAVGRDSYRWFWLGQQEASWFGPITDDGRPFPGMAAVGCQLACI